VELKANAKKNPDVKDKDTDKNGRMDVDGGNQQCNDTPKGGKLDLDKQIERARKGLRIEMAGM
jgi:hypothetical protein